MIYQHANKWDENETDLLKFLFAIIKKSDKEKTLETIMTEFNKLNFQVRSYRSIKRKAYFLGLLGSDNGRIIKVCDCGVEIVVPVNLKDRAKLCEACQKKKRQTWAKSEAGRKYFRDYQRKYKKRRKTSD